MDDQNLFNENKLHSAGFIVQRYQQLNLRLAKAIQAKDAEVIAKTLAEIDKSFSAEKISKEDKVAHDKARAMIGKIGSLDGIRHIFPNAL